MSVVSLPYCFGFKKNINHMQEYGSALPLDSTTSCALVCYMLQSDIVETQL